MVMQLSGSDDQFEAKLAAKLAAKLETGAEVNDAVAKILADVAQRGDAAVLDYTARFDKAEHTAQTLRVPPEAMQHAWNNLPEKLKTALELAAKRIWDYHRRQVPKDERYTEEGITLGWRWTAIETAGLYVPGGTAVYPSSVLMNAIPALAAGVKRLVMCSPTPGGEMNPMVLAAAHVAGVKEIYQIGGAQAVAAMAFGTETIPKVDVIVGPGNAYVAAAKRQVYGLVGIDSIAGPSEILVIADHTANPRWVAADLLSQAEHDPASRSVLVTPDAGLAKEVMRQVDELVETLNRADIARESWEKNGLVVQCRDVEDAARISNLVAPEHLELFVQAPEKLVEHITHAGAIFMGKWTPEAIGDYTAGPSHVLPTAGTPRFASGLSVFDFLKRSSMIQCEEQGFAHLAEATYHLAHAEGLGAHGLSVAVRLEEKG